MSCLVCRRKDKGLIYMNKTLTQTRLTSRRKQMRWHNKKGRYASYKLKTQRNKKSTRRRKHVQESKNNYTKADQTQRHCVLQLTSYGWHGNQLKINKQRNKVSIEKELENTHQWRKITLKQRKCKVAFQKESRQSWMREKFIT